LAALGPPRSRDHWPIAPASSPCDRQRPQWCRWPALAAKGRLGALGGRPRPPSDHPSCAYLVTVSPRGHAQFSDRMPRTTWLWHGNPSRVSPGTSSRRRCSSRALVHRVHGMAAFARWCLRTVFRQDFVGGQIGNATLRIKFIFQGLKDSKYFQILFYYKPPVTECPRHMSKSWWPELFRWYERGSRLGMGCRVEACGAAWRLCVAPAGGDSKNIAIQKSTFSLFH